jgi:tRNA pseudouridine38-40 synthase
MVRNIVGALFDIGRARRTPEWIDELLAERDRRFGPVMAPPQGLSLVRIGFNGDQLDND